jgi:hypothetical protein
MHLLGRPELYWNYKHISVRSYVLVGQPVDLIRLSSSYSKNILAQSGAQSAVFVLVSSFRMALSASA